MHCEKGNVYSYIHSVKPKVLSKGRVQLVMLMVDIPQRISPLFPPRVSKFENHELFPECI